MAYIIQTLLIHDSNPNRLASLEVNPEGGYTTISSFFEGHYVVVDLNDSDVKDMINYLQNYLNTKKK